MFQSIRSIVPLLFISYPFTCSAAFTSEIVNNYPACDYQVIDTIKVNSSFQATSNTEFAEQYKLTIDKLLSRLVEAGTAINATYLVIIDKEVGTKFGDKNIVLRAEALDGCETTILDPKNFAPYNKLAEKQAGFSKTIKHKWEVIVDIDEKPVKPALSDDISISLTSGIYGVPLGTTKDEVVALFGTPSFEMRMSDDTLLLSYGRDHWLSFNDGKLKKAEFNPSDITWSLKNYIAVDERFADREWRISDSLYKNAKIKTDELKSLNLTQENTESKLSVKTTTYLESNQQYVVTKITGFNLVSKDFRPRPAPKSKKQHNQEFFNHLFNLIENIGQGNGVALQALGVEPSAIIYADSNSKYLLMSPIMLLKSGGDLITKVIINPDLANNAQLSDWRFGPFQYNQSSTDALNIDSEDTYFFDDVMELDMGRYLVKLFFENDKLKSLEINLY